MNLQAHKLNLIQTLLDTDDAKLLSRVETFIKAEIAAKREKEIVPMTMDEYNRMIDLSLDDARAGRTVSHEEAKRRAAQW